MRKNIFTLLCCLLLTTSATLVYADSLETEIQLFEVVGIGDLVGDDPLGNPHQQDPIPPRPNDFHATISGRILEVSVDNSNLTTVIVRNAAGNTVVDDSFYALTSQQLSSAGTYTLEIHNADMTLIGQFEAE